MALDLAAVADVGQLAGVLRELRRREGRRRGGPQLNYRQLAERTGCSIGTLSSYLSGKVLPPTDRFDEIVRALGANPAEQRELATARDRVEEERRPRVVAPHLLPQDVADFTGRSAELTRLDAEASAGIVTVTGAPGIGKSALAVRWAYRARDRFGDGQLHINLRGYAAAAPLRPDEVLGGLLRSLGVPAEQIPATVDEAARVFRARVAGQRLLIILDDARSADQVRPVLTGEASMLVIVTSRNQLPGLIAANGARQLELGLLGDDEALGLLEAAVGAERIAADPAAAAELVAACGRLPLALRIAAATLAARPRLTVAAYRRRLGTQHRLSALDFGDSSTAVRGAFFLSYQAVPTTARRLFRLLGLMPGLDISESAAVALLGDDEATAIRAIDQLCTANLVAQVGADRFGMHDLVRCYAAERAVAEDSAADRVSALARLYGWYEAGAWSASEGVHPERVRLPRTAPADRWAAPDALAWLAAEQQNLFAVVHRADAGAAAWRIIDSIRAYCGQSVSTGDWRAAADTALRAAHAAGDGIAQASAHLSLAEIARRVGDYAAAISHYEQASALSAAGGWTTGQAAALGNLGTICRYAGRADAAVAHFAASAALNQRAGRASGLAAALGGLGIALRELGDLPASADRLRAALELYRQAGSAAGSAAALQNLGEAVLAQDRPRDAMAYFRESLALFRSRGDAPGQAIALCGIAAAHAAVGAARPALTRAAHAIAIGWDTADCRIRLDLLLGAADVHAKVGRPPDALAHYEQALHLARTTGTRYAEAAALVGIAELGGGPGAARQAESLAAHCGYRILHRRAAGLLPGPARAGQTGTTKGIAS